MAGVPLLETKFRAASRRRGVVGRPRLAARLAPHAIPALTLVSAPAGFGKTTLLAEWLTTSDARTAWVSLDGRDNDGRVFWTYVVTSIRRVVEGVGDHAGALLDEGASIDAVVTTLLNELGRVETEVVVVLDDYHLIDSVEVHESVRFLVENLSSHGHLVLSARADPPWPLAGLRARGELMELRADDLRFTAEEAASYLDGVMDLGLSDAQIAALEARTEGWIAALQLAALSLQGRENPAGFIVDYLADEVLDRQSDEVRTFLLHTSILGRLTGPLCDAVTGGTGGKATLDALERANMFLVPLDDRRVWYRYHHLFADVLTARLLDDYPGTVAVLHRRASDWYEDHGDRPEAIRHAFAADDLPRAAALIERAAPAMRQARQEATLRSWLEALPPELLTERPVLNLGLVGARIASGDFHGIEAILDDVDQQLDPTRRSSFELVVVDEAEFARLPAQTAMYRAALALLTGDTAGTIAHVQRVLELTPEHDHMGHGAANALLGLAHWTLGDLTTAEDRYAQSVNSFVDAQHYADVLGCARALADIETARGHLNAAVRTLESGLEIARRHGPLRGTADMHAGLSDLCRERNELRAARFHVDASARLGDHEALPPNAHRWRVALAQLLQIDGDYHGALDLLREAHDVYDTDFSPSIRPIPAVTARMHLAQGDLAAARRWVTERGVTADDEPSYLTEYEHLTLARVLLAQHSAGANAPALHAANALLERLRASADSGGRGSVIEITALQSLAHHSTGNTPRAIATLTDALDAAEPEGYVRVFLDEGATMIELLELTAQHSALAEPARRVLAARDTSPAVDAAVDRRPAAPSVLEPLSSRELDVLRLLRSDLSGPEIARELMVSLNTMRTHTKNIYMKLGVNSRRSAVRKATELGL